MEKLATLVPALMEVCYLRVGRSSWVHLGMLKPRYEWVEGFKVIDPQGREIQPCMRKREAYAYCQSQQWDYVVKHSHQ